jgi:hypothetical protein
VEESRKLKKHNNLLSALPGNGMMLSGRCYGTGTRLLQLLDIEVSVETDGSPRREELRIFSLLMSFGFVKLAFGQSCIVFDGRSIAGNARV